jgi:hypothetical protein
MFDIYSLNLLKEYIAGTADIHVKIGHMLKLISIMWLYLVLRVWKSPYLGP